MGGGLLVEVAGKLHPGDAEDGGVVLHLAGVDDLPAVDILFQHNGAVASPRGVDGGGHPRSAGANDDNIGLGGLTHLFPLL